MTQSTGFNPYSILSIIIVVLFAAVGGEIVKMFQGEAYGRFKFKDRCGAFKVPPLVLMIVFGCVARNFFGWILTDVYPEVWADWMRQLCLSFILMRGGLELRFKKNGIVVIFFALIPQICEVVCGSLIINSIFGMPTLVTITNGILLSALSPGILVPGVMMLIDGKLGT
jgi:hypothetical protein